jgi:hypothetical protein
VRFTQEILSHAAEFRAPSTGQFGQDRQMNYRRDAVQITGVIGPAAEQKKMPGEAGMRHEKYGSIRYFFFRINDLC